MDTAADCIALSDLRYQDPLIAGLDLPRTRSHVLLQALGLPVLRGCLVLAHSSAALSRAREIMEPDRSALVRSDPLLRGNTSIRGGDIWPLDRLEECANKYISHGRALILLEPYERTANIWSFAVLGGLVDWGFALEIVGAGFDTGHLNRGRTVPHERFEGDTFGKEPRVTKHAPFDHDRYAEDLRTHDVRRAPGDGKPLPHTTLHAILRSLHQVSEMDFAAPFVLSGAVLQPGERLVFWDIYQESQRNR